MSSAPPTDLQDRLARVELVLLDVDGVLTDGRVLMGPGQQEFTSFSVRDGLAMKLALLGGLPVGVVSGRNSDTTRSRAEQLGLPEIHLGFHAKLPVVEEILKRRGLSFDALAYMGDDIIDLPVLKHAGLAAAPADACAEVLAACHFRSSQEGGRGCVRDLLEGVLKARKQWDSLVEEVCGKGL